MTHFFKILGWQDPLRVQIVTAHHNCIAAAYPHFVAVFKQRESNNKFSVAYTTPYVDAQVERVAINAKMGSVLPQCNGEMVRVFFYFSFFCCLALINA